MANSISRNNSRQLWNEVHKTRSKYNVSSQCMDEVVCNVTISEVFASTYMSLYNSVGSDRDELNSLLSLNSGDIVE